MGFTHKDFLYEDIASMRRTINILQKGIVLKSREYLKTYHGIKIDMEGLKKLKLNTFNIRLRWLKTIKNMI